MNELTQRMIEQKCEIRKDSFALLLYTPFCGTCKLTERMLLVVSEMDPQIPLFKANINLMPSLATRWKITSVPCLLIIKQGEIAEQLYAMRSVDYLYHSLQTLR